MKQQNVHVSFGVSSLIDKLFFDFLRMAIESRNPSSTSPTKSVRFSFYLSSRLRQSPICCLFHVISTNLDPKISFHHLAFTASRSHAFVHIRRFCMFNSFLSCP